MLTVKTMYLKYIAVLIMNLCKGGAFSMKVSSEFHSSSQLWGAVGVLVLTLCPCARWLLCVAYCLMAAVLDANQIYENSEMGETSKEDLSGRVWVTDEQIEATGSSRGKKRIARRKMAKKSVILRWRRATSRASEALRTYESVHIYRSDISVSQK